MRGNAPAAYSTGEILGYGGLWKIDGEAHISTIAIHPANRGLGYGEVLLAGMFGKALQLDAEFIVLEVRVSNSVAEPLPEVRASTAVARKKNYYRSDNEDAWDMAVSLGRDTRHRFDRLYENSALHHGFSDSYSRSPHPRDRFHAIAECPNIYP